MLGTNLYDGIFIKGLIVKTSTIENAGKGLFTQQDIPKGIILGYYKGDRYTEEKYLNSDIIGIYTWENNYNDNDNDNNDNDNVEIKVKKPSIYIDASNIYTSNILRFVNDYKNDEYNNVDVLKTDEHIYYITNRYIKEGSELFINYGNEYWVDDKVDT